jgi:hypothetical protein
MRLVGRARGAPQAVQKQHLVAGVDEGMHGLAQHGRAARERGGGELRGRNQEVAEEGRVDHLRGRARHVSSAVAKIRMGALP